MADSLFLSLHAPWSDYDGQFTSQDMKTTSRRLGLPRWKRSIHASVPLLAAAQRAIEQLDGPESEIGVISVGSDLAANHTEGFLRRARDGKPDLVNPLDFPHTLSSALPSTMAQVLGAKSFAFVMGDTPKSILDTLQFADDALSVGMAKAVLITLCDEERLVDDGASAATPEISIPTAGVLCLTRNPHPGAAPLLIYPDDHPAIAFEATILDDVGFGPTFLALESAHSHCDGIASAILVDQRETGLSVATLVDRAEFGRLE